MGTRRHYYVISPNVWKDSTQKYFEKVMFDEHIVLMGWDVDSEKGKMFANVRVGDVAIVAQGANWQKRLFFAGIVSNDSYKYESEVGDVAQCRNLKCFTDLRQAIVPFNTDCAHGSSNQIPAIYRLKNENEADVAVMNEIDKLLMNTQKIEFMNQYVRLLEAKKNIILQGAPGTGKTYSTASIAVAMCNETFTDFNDHGKVMAEYERLQDEGQIAFCTFHQSMDYEDFVEGLKPFPVKGDNGQIVGMEYKVEDGIFKTICNDAMENLKLQAQPQKKDYSDLFEQYCSDLERRLAELDSNSQEATVNLNPDKKNVTVKEVKRNINSGRAINIIVNSGTTNKSLTKKIFDRDYEQFKAGTIKTYSDIKPSKVSSYKSHGLSAYYFLLFEDISRFEKKSSIVSQQGVEAKNYVLVIDEINRGNVSRIFGELITLLESDKRVKKDAKDEIHKLKVKLPYSKNFIDDDDDNGFSVPDNLYIIGTMNTTDRSTGTIDYAVRRRFAFITLESSMSVIEEWYKNNNVEDKENVMNAALALFKEINGEDASDEKSFIAQHKSADLELEDLKVGHSYFMAPDIDTLCLKMKFEVIPLIKEYIKDGILQGKAEDKDYFSKWTNAQCKG